MSTQPHTPTTHSRLISVGALAIAIAAVALPGSATAERERSPGACTVRPSAETLPFEVVLLETYRQSNGIPEILHDVKCSDGRTGTVWIGPDLI
jgi:hypothetical protein